MKIKMERVNNRYWIADFIELPGSPYIGTGRTKVEAVIALFIRNKKDILKLDFTKVEINGILWREGK